MSKLTAIFVCIFLLSQTLAAFMKNQYTIEAENIAACPNNAQIGSPIKKLTFSRYNKTHKALSVDFTYPRDLDEKIGAQVMVEKWGDAGWIRMPFIHFQPNVCNYFLKHFAAVWIKFHTNVGVENPDRCPIPAGNYSAKNFLMDTAQIDIPFFSGRFRLTTMHIVADTKEVIYCILSIVKVTEIF